MTAATQRLPPIVIVAVISLAVALAVRLAFLAEAWDSPFLAHALIDEQDYRDLALRLARGEWPGHEALFRPPLYPAFLALLHQLVGDDTRSLRLLQLQLGAVAAPLTAVLGSQVLGTPVRGLVCGLGVALYGPLVYYDAQLLAASLDALLVVAIVTCVLRADGTGSSRDWAAAGAVLGLSATNRGSMVLVVPFVVGWSLFGSGAARDKLRRLAFFLGSAGLVVAPLAWHNARYDHRPERIYAPEARLVPDEPASLAQTFERIATGSYSPLGWAGGVNLYIGNEPGSVGVNRDWDVTHFHWFADINAEPWRDGVTTAHGHSEWFSSRLRHEILARPVAWTRLVGTKVAQVVNGYEIPRGTSPYAERASSRVLSSLLWETPLRFPTGLVLPLGLVGAWVLRRNRRAQLVSLVLFVQLLFVVVFFVTSRYRLPALPLAIVLAVGFVQTIHERVRHSGWWLPTAGTALAAVVAIGLSNVRLADQRFERSPVEHYALAYELYDDGHAPEAIAQLELAVSKAPGFSDAHTLLGMALVADRRPAEAMVAYERAIELDPSSVSAWTQLGLAHQAARDLDRAEADLSRAVELAPQQAAARYHLGVVLGLQGRIEEARRRLAEARELGADDPKLVQLIAETEAHLPAVGSAGP